MSALKTLAPNILCLNKYNTSRLNVTEKASIANVSMIRTRSNDRYLENLKTWKKEIPCTFGNLGAFLPADMI